MKRDVYFPDDRQTKILMREIGDMRRATGKSFSKITQEALRAHVDAKRVYVQAKLTDYTEEFILKLETLHQELVFPNVNKRPNWKAVLEAEGLLTLDAIAYSKKRGWRVD